MISVNPIGEFNAESNLPDGNRRRRTPSKYAESIRELTKVLNILILDHEQKLPKGEKFRIK